MARNYDSSNVGVEYIRVPRILIEYPSPDTAQVTCWEVSAVKMADGSIRELQQLGDSLRWSIGPGDMAAVLPMVHPTTGEAIPGQATTNAGLSLGLLAAIRQHQLARDAAEATPPAPESEAP